MACSKPFTLTASLNDSRWFSTGELTEVHTEDNQTCLIDRFSITVRTDLPYNQENRGPSQKATGCIGKCKPTQVLGIYHVPMKKGTYNLALPDTCLPIRSHRSSRSFAVARASLQLIDPQTGGTRKAFEFLEGDEGWIRIAKLNRATGQVQGQFEMTLTSSNGQSAQFTKGKFNGKLLSQ
jgi:hypothetical protein